MSTTSQPAVPANDRAALRRSISNTLKGSAGNLVEWYDVYVYSVFAVYFESQFFSPEDKNSTLYVWAIFAATFLMRPIGAWFFGRFADRHGRRLALTVSVTLMAFCSFIIAITPTAASIGIWAAIILLFARLLQGFATGGEYGASATYMSEAAIPGRRGFLSSFHYVTLVGGHVLAQLTLLLMLTFWGKPEISEWGWRIAFGIGGIAAVVVFWLRRGMDESLSESSIEAARKGKAQKSGSMYELFVHQWRPLLLCFLITQLPHQHDATLAFLTLALAFVILTGYTSINAVVKAELFPTHVRALGVGLGYALANSLFGGTAPLLYQGALKTGHVDWFAIYVTATIAVSLVVYVFFLTNKGPNWLDGTRK